jgi:hypothetical protein
MTIPTPVCVSLDGTATSPLTWDDSKLAVQLTSLGRHGPVALFEVTSKAFAVDTYHCGSVSP